MTDFLTYLEYTLLPKKCAKPSIYIYLYIYIYIYIYYSGSHYHLFNNNFFVSNLILLIYKFCLYLVILRPLAEKSWLKVIDERAIR